MSSYFNRRRGIYRSRNGKIFGVCKGVADRFDFSVTVVRLIAILLLIFTGIWPILAIYILAALLMKPEPVLAPESNGEREFYDYYASSRRSAIDRLKGTFDDLNRRVQSMEETVIDKEYDWEQRLKAGS